MRAGPITVFAPPLPESVERPALIVTATRRQALWLTREVSERARAAGTLPTPVMPLDDLLAAVWERHGLNELDAPVLCPPGREFALFEAALRDCPPATPPLRRQPFIESLQQAWRTAWDWALPPVNDHAPAALSAEQPDVAWFAALSQAVRARLLHAGAITRAELLDALSELPVDRLRLALRLRGPLLFIGHHEDRPAFRRWRDALRGAGVEASDWAPAGPIAPPQVMRCEDVDAEIDAAAAWCRALLDAHRPDLPPPRIIVVVPGLERLRDRVRARFAAWIDPDWLDPSRPPRPAAFNITGADRLADLTPVRSALALLDAVIEPTEATVLGKLLTQCLSLAPPGTLDVALRESSCGPLTLTAWLDEAAALERVDALAPLRRAAAQLAGAVREGTQRPIAEWWGVFNALLAHAGWPGDRAVPSEHWQILESWRTLDADVAALSGAQDPVSARHALEWLRTAARLRQFSPQGAAAPVQICGPLEADGLTCSHLWIAGLRADQWPAPPRPSPFLSLAAQRRAASPHSSLARETRFSGALLERLARGADEYRVSYPVRDDRGPVMPSHFLARMGAGIDAASVDDPGLEATRQWAPVRGRIVERPDETLPLESDEAAGGAGLLDFQSLCPFGALARYRLAAQRPRERAPWPDALERGNALHGALEAFWSKLPDQSALVELSPADRQRRVARAAARGLGALKRNFSVAQRRHEQARLERVLEAWLEVEAARAPFAIASTEKKLHARHGGLRFTLQADRIDRVPTGASEAICIIDYKTGTSVPPPLESAQLRAYAVALAPDASPVGAVMIAGVGPGEDRKLRLFRLREDVEIGATKWTQGRPQTFAAAAETLIESWRAALDDVAASHAAGALDINPEASPKACERCENWGLCRWDGARKGTR